jgi:branched-chain amino acid aminotransferase
MTSPLSPSGIPLERVERSRWVDADWSAVPFGSVYSDHMLIAEFQDGRWNTPSIRPYGPLPLPPSISGLHYGLSVFEGLKAHRGPNGDILLFRPHDNARRLQRSAARFVMPEPPESLSWTGSRPCSELTKDGFPPTGRGPLHSAGLVLGGFVDPPRTRDRFLFVVFSCPFASYYPPSRPAGRPPVCASLPGGTGDHAGRQLCPDVHRRREARSGLPDRALARRLGAPIPEECGAMNVFVCSATASSRPSSAGRSCRE